MMPVELRLTDDIKIIDADPSQLQQVVMNLAVNARDAMPDGGRLVIEATNWEQNDSAVDSDLGIPTGQYVKLSISDTGSGMDQETISKVFDPFFTTKNPGQGTGLGLSIVYGIVKSHHAHIHCYSEPGVGTTFNIYFPVSTEESIIGSETQTDLPAGHGENLLLVDDDQSIVKVGRKILTNFGYCVLSASNGAEAVDIYNEKKDSIDLVVLDLIMPLMGGRECLARILSLNPKAKVVIASGYSADGRLESVLDEGAQAVISKPYEARQILQTVRQVLDSG